MNQKTRPQRPLSDEELEILKEKTTDIPGLIAYAHERGGFAITLTSPDEIKSNAVKSMHEQVETQLAMLHERMSVLAKQAQELKNRAIVSSELFEISPGFTPVAGKTYFLYLRATGEKVLSLIAPEEWKQMPFKEFLASVKYLSDKTWQLVSSESSKSESDK